MSESTEYAIETIHSTIFELIPWMSNYWDEGPDFDSYAEWIADELLQELRASPDETPLQVVSRMHETMIRYAGFNKNGRRMFSVAADILENIEEALSQSC